MPKKGSKNASSGSADRIADSRFSSFETDPRFRLPKKGQGKTTIDKRFSRLLKDDAYTNQSRVDRYGRKLKNDSKKKALERLYEKEKDSEDEEEEEEEEGDDISVDDDEVVQRELRKAHEKYDPARGGGFGSSDEESDTDSEDEVEEETVEGEMQRLQNEQGDLEEGEITKRIAIVNLDWDQVRAVDLYSLFSSFADEGGKVESVVVYPSEFGKERMQQEELEGPPKELFKGKKADSDDDEEESDAEDADEKIRKELLQEGDDQDFDSDALRKYQLDRLRYYYAIMTCSDEKTAKKIYEAVDGTEYHSSSNFLDLRFVPDDTDFDDEPRDQCDRMPEDYQPVEFVTNALQSSKVKLTWDMHPEENARKESMRKAFSGSRKDIDENDLKTYLASDSEESDNEEVEVVVAGDEPEAEGEKEDEPKLSKKELQRKKMREALGLTEEPMKKASKGEHVGDMQITFTPGLSENAKSKKGADEEETTIEKYKRKERERKERKRAATKARREGVDPEAMEEDQEEGGASLTTGGDDLGFNDPFFTNEDISTGPSKSSVRKEERLKKRADREAAEATSAAEKAHLQKIMAADKDDNQVEHLDHFDMADIMKAEKQKNKKFKGKSKKNIKDTSEMAGLQDGFSMDLKDDRFKAAYDDHQYAIDPSNPTFKGTEGMKQLLEEKRKRRGDGEEGRSNKKSKRR